jgi:hypothetical protein
MKNRKKDEVVTSIRVQHPKETQPLVVTRVRLKAGQKLQKVKKGGAR